MSWSPDKNSTSARSHRLRHGNEPPCSVQRRGARLPRSARIGLRREMPQAKEGTRHVDDVFEVDELAALSNHIEQVAMLAGGRVGPFAGGSLSQLLEPHDVGFLCPE